MRFSEYTKIAGSTAIYPDRGNNLPYVVLGLVDGACELMEACEVGVDGISAEDRDRLLKEVGDVLWYASQVTFEANLELGVDDLGTLGVDWPAASLVRSSDVGAFETAASIVMIAGRVAGFTKKAIRDTGGSLTEISKIEVGRALVQILILADSLACCINSGMMTLGDVARMNLAKLQSRKERGVIGGSGDNR
jgi:hypothetical protein